MKILSLSFFLFVLIIIVNGQSSDSLRQLKSEVKTIRYGQGVLQKNFDDFKSEVLSLFSEQSERISSAEEQQKRMGEGLKKNVSQSAIIQQSVDGQAEQISSLRKSGSWLAISLFVLLVLVSIISIGLFFSLKRKIKTAKDVLSQLFDEKVEKLKQSQMQIEADIQAFRDQSSSEWDQWKAEIEKDLHRAELGFEKINRKLRDDFKLMQDKLKLRWKKVESELSSLEKQVGKADQKLKNKVTELREEGKQRYTELSNSLSLELKTLSIELKHSLLAQDKAIVALQKTKPKKSVKKGSKVSMKVAGSKKPS